jgi:hypothetical protein
MIRLSLDLQHTEFLEFFPDSPNALILLGVIAHQDGKNEPAVEYNMEQHNFDVERLRKSYCRIRHAHLGVRNEFPRNRV